MKKSKARQSRGINPPGRFLTLKEAAQRLGRQVGTVRRLIARGRLHAMLVAHNVMVPEDAVTEFLAPRPWKPKPAPVCAGWNDKLREELARREQTAEAQS